MQHSDDADDAAGNVPCLDVVEEEEEDVLLSAWTADTSMLADHDRNDKYAEALRRLAPGQRVLDIGTGTGLLAMLAARHGATTVTACEVYRPMARIAAETIRTNNLEATIALVPKESTELSLEKDLNQQRVGLIVSEIVDSELLGEGILPSIRDAVARLGLDTCTCIPCAANIHFQLIQSDLLRSWVDLDSCSVDGLPIFDEEMISRVDASTKHEVHVDRLLSSLTRLSDPTTACTLDLTSIPPEDGVHTEITTAAVASGSRVDGLVMWWTMTLADDIVIDTQPSWLQRAQPHHQHTQHQQPQQQQQQQQQSHVWREHWLPMVYVLRQPLQTAQNEDAEPKTVPVYVGLHHDDFAVDFSAALAATAPPLRPTHVHVCSPLLPRDRIALLNDTRRTQHYHDALAASTHGRDIRSILGFGSVNVAAISACQLFPRAHTTVVEHRRLAPIMEAFATRASARLSVVVDEDSMGERDTADVVDLVVGEPYFLDTTEPWQAAIRFARAIARHRHRLSATAVVFPHHAVVCCALVECTHLHTIRDPVKQACGVDMSAFDAAVRVPGTFASVQSMWEYEHRLLCRPAEVLTIDFAAASAGDGGIAAAQSEDVVLTMTTTGTCHAVLVFMRTYLSDQEFEDEYSGDGAYTPFKQGVFLLDDKRRSVNCGESVTVHVSLDGAAGTVSADVVS
ncbi:hypothetical protein PTSG_11677 [Salpingoeca rosetta]|uniref:Protein arginine N-methyltransferase n=1 Tax=Salpingoeca rosetta (strain ATCC 50818 / BSB-021) TaxID=946362 RepID=F2TY81_SALR5|nr:uncharacterized protein PTSG_11677 [Salpingoeca rosetta]EGD76340.1 hypothetical protein PTSG_11677 [Salpingoeca rosetta]|eukprot:XP_004998515.1 hypothetical protein PTSG_11677 [Salpingoeca rosetta]